MQETSAPSAAQGSTAPAWEFRRGQSRDTIVLSGDWVAGAAPKFDPACLAGSAAHDLAFEAGALGRWDTTLIDFLWEAKRATAAGNVTLDGAALPRPAQTLLGLLPAVLGDPAPPPRHRFRPVWWVGGEAIGFLSELGVLSTLGADMVTGAVRATLGRARMRGIDLLDNIRDAGPSALVIVSVVNFLIGGILAFVGAVQLRKFAADIYVANLVGLALVREMSAVMTAIIMAGRTGGAYAARIASMEGNEEIDALDVIGIPVGDYILLPAVLSLALTMPILYLYGCFVGMFGGFLVAIAMLNVTAIGYVHQILEAIPLDQFVFGFVKSIAFAVLIGVTSCRIGLTAGRSAADVGAAATHAVVVGIVGVIAVDAAFAVLADALGI